MNIRIVKGYNSAITLPGMMVTSAVLEYNGKSVELETSANAVIIRAEQIQDAPVPKRANATFECVMLINGDTRIPCFIVANPLKPRV